jgi:two-component system sensor histidine kinase MtrB
MEDTKLHHGWLQAWGRKGDGANFRLTLPLRQDAVITESPVQLEPKDVTNPGAPGSVPGEQDYKNMLVLQTGGARPVPPRAPEETS